MDLPRAPGEEEAKQAAWASLQAATLAPKTRRRTWWGQRLTFSRWALAALLVIAVGVGVLFSQVNLGVSGEARAGSVLLGQLATWNADLGSSASIDDRRRLYAEHATRLAADFRQSTLESGDREIAEALLANASWFARHDDPIEAADRFNDLADQLADRIEMLRARGDQEGQSCLATAYGDLVEKGLETSLDRATAQEIKTPGQAQKITDVTEAMTSHLHRMQQMLDKVPPPARKGIQRAIDAQSKHDHGNPHNKIPPGLQKKISAQRNGVEGAASRPTP